MEYQEGRVRIIFNYLLELIFALILYVSEHLKDICRDKFRGPSNRLLHTSPKTDSSVQTCS
jgi:hypothetical protein